MFTPECFLTPIAQLSGPPLRGNPEFKIQPPLIELISMIPENDNPNGNGNGLSAEVLGQIRKAVSNLEEINSTTESEFLTIGENLQGFYQQANELYQHGEKAAGLISGKEINSALENLHDIIERIRTNLDSSGKKHAGNLDTINRVVHLLRTVYRITESFQTIVMSMRMMGIAIRIESANLSRGGRIFRVFARQVVGQSTAIESKVLKISNELDHQAEQISKTHSKLLNLNSLQQQKGRQAVKNIESSLTSLAKKQDESSRMAAHISDQSRDISSNVGEIVTSVQFHDITRQQIEHVTLALGEFNEESDLSQTQDICRLQSMHLVFARDRFTDAVTNIIDYLREITGDVRSLSSEVMGLIGETGNGKAGFLAKMDQEMSLATSALNEYSKMTAELSRAVVSVVEISEAMSAFLVEVDEIAYTIKTISLNAAIKASKIGEEGAAMEIVSKGIQELSRDAFEISTEVSTTLAQLMEEVRILREETFAINDTSAEGLENVAGELGGILGSIRQMNDQSIDKLREMDAVGLDLIGKIDKTIREITVGELMKVKINQSISGLEKITGPVSEHDWEMLTPERKAFMNRLAEQYTMKHEREIHHAWNEKSARDIKIFNGGEKLFDEDEGEGFGGNVELF